MENFDFRNELDEFYDREDGSWCFSLYFKNFDNEKISFIDENDVEYYGFLLTVIIEERPDYLPEKNIYIHSSIVSEDCLTRESSYLLKSILVSEGFFNSSYGNRYNISEISDKFINSLNNEIPACKALCKFLGHLQRINKQNFLF